MGLFEHFPYTNLHELNLDWILFKVKKNTEDTADAAADATAAKDTADQAILDAAAAQHTADQAILDAAAAQHTADQAILDAAAAMAAAQSASPTIFQIIADEDNNTCYIDTDMDFEDIYDLCVAGKAAFRIFTNYDSSGYIGMLNYPQMMQVDVNKYIGVTEVGKGLSDQAINRVYVRRCYFGNATDNGTYQTVYLEPPLG